MRDQFRKNLHRRTTRGERSGKKLIAYKYEESLQFIIPYYTDKETKEVSSSCTERMVQTDDIFMDDLLNGQFDLTSTTDSFCSNVANAKDEEENAKEPPGDFLDACIGTKNTLTDLHPMDAFLFGLSCTLKTFSPYYQSIAKSKLFSIVQSLEMEQLSPTNEPPKNKNITKVEVTKTYYTQKPIIISAPNNDIYFKHTPT